jgi:hypothetical protein
MGGHVTVHSKLREGTTFSVLYPCIEPHSERPTKKRRSNENAINSFEAPKLGAKVLLVDDSNFNQTVVKALLERADCAVETASNGEEAIEKYAAATTPFDVVLMDITMPIVSFFLPSASLSPPSSCPSSSFVFFSLSLPAFFFSLSLHSPSSLFVFPSSLQFLSCLRLTCFFVDEWI